MADKVPGKAWVVVFCGTAVNLCLGILYAWSIWAGALVPKDLKMAGTVMTGLNDGWVYLTNAEAATPFSLCVVIFALLMIPGGRIQDKISPRFGAIVGGLFLALGCIIAGVTKSYTGLIVGFGIFGGIGMGIGYAAPTPAALSWFGPHKRGLIAGLVVGGYGGAALYVSPLGAYLLSSGGLTYSFVVLGILFAVVTIIAGSQLEKAPPGYVAPAAVVKAGAAPAKAAGTLVDWAPSDMLKTWQCYALILMFIGTTQSGLLVIANAAGLLGTTAKAIPFFAANAWILASYGGSGERGRPGGHGHVLRQDRPGQRLCPELHHLGGLPVPDALHHRGQERLLPVHRRGYRLLAVRRRAGADALFHRRLLWAQKPGHELRHSVPGMGFRLLHGPLGRQHQRLDRQAGLCFLSVGPGPGHRGDPLLDGQAAVAGTREIITLGRTTRRLGLAFGH